MSQLRQLSCVSGKIFISDLDGIEFVQKKLESGEITFPEQAYGTIGYEDFFGVFINVPKNNSYAISIFQNNLGDQEFTITLADGNPSYSEKIGYIHTRGNVMFCDTDCIGYFKSQSIDNKVDIAYWGHDVQRLVKKLGLQQIDRQSYGWRDVSLEEVDEKLALLNKKRRPWYKLKFWYGDPVMVHPHTNSYLMSRKLMDSYVVHQNLEDAVSEMQFKNKTNAIAFDLGTDGVVYLCADYEKKGGRIIQVRSSAT